MGYFRTGFSCVACVFFIFIFRPLSVTTNSAGVASTDRNDQMCITVYV